MTGLRLAEFETSLEDGLTDFGRQNPTINRAARQRAIGGGHPFDLTQGPGVADGGLVAALSDP